MSIYINPFTDFGFKKLFGEETAKELLIAFLNELLAEEQGIIEDITYLNTEQFGSSEEHRKAFFDLYCRNQRGEHFIVEIQRQKQKNFKERLLYYSTFPIQQQAHRGEWKFELSAVYVIAIMDFELEKSLNSNNSVLSRVQLLNTETFDVFYNKLTYIYLEVPKFKKAENELENLFDKWLFLLRNMERLHNIPNNIKEQIFMKFLEKAELAKLSDEDRFKYERSLKVYRDDLLVMTTKFEEGIEVGSKRIAKKLLKKGMPIKEVIEITGLSFEEIMELKSEL
jgi:predicted transposase/invertase (TIGR01784 family)